MKIVRRDEMIKEVGRTEADSAHMDGQEARDAFERSTGGMGGSFVGRQRQQRRRLSERDYENKLGQESMLGAENVRQKLSPMMQQGLKDKNWREDPRWSAAAHHIERVARAALICPVIRDPVASSSHRRAAPAQL